MAMINSINNNPINMSAFRPEAEVPATGATHSEETPNPAVQDGFETKQSGLEGYSRDVKELVHRLAVANKMDESEVPVISGTDGDDNIYVTYGTKPGEIIVDINGEKQSVENGIRGFVLDGGKGDDTIVVNPNLCQGMYITGGEGNDKIVCGRGGSVIIDNYGANTITGSAGNDVIIAGGFDLDPNATVGLAPEGPKEAGGLVINGNIIYGLGGNDYIQGGKANDYIDAGPGRNVVYGMSGNDFITAGEGENYISGGEGNDVIQTTGGRNILVGGHGDDTIMANAGSNVIVSGQGHNAIEGDKKAAGDRPNKVFVNSQSSVAQGQGDQVKTLESVNIPSTFTIQGEKIGSATVTAAPGTAEFHEQSLKAAFAERVIDDLETLAALPQGQTMFAALEPTGKQVDFVPTDKGNCCEHFSGSSLDDQLKPGPGSNSVVHYNLSKISTGGTENWAARPTIVGMFHEMCHSYNSAMGNLDGRYLSPTGQPATCAEDWYYMSPGCEYQAVGLKNPAVQANPQGITENDLRNELNLAYRDAY